MATGLPPSSSEPVVGNMNLIVPTAEFLGAMRELTARHGAVLIFFDEVMTGFRVGLNSAQGRGMARPTCPPSARWSAAACPRRPSAADAKSWNNRPLGPVYQAGTLSG